MAKTKHLKYQRVMALPNVVIPEDGPGSGRLPWNEPPWRAQGLILELGCGKGEHSLALARAFPDRAVLGVDIKSHRLCSGGEKGLALGLMNLFFLRAPVEQIMDFVEKGCVREIWLTFPDPHPKQREIRRRLTAPGFMAAYAALLGPGGKIHLKTDSDLLYRYTRNMVSDWGGRILAETGDLGNSDCSGPGVDNVGSAFEIKAVNRQQTIKYLKFSLD